MIVIIIISQITSAIKKKQEQAEKQNRLRLAIKQDDKDLEEMPMIKAKAASTSNVKAKGKSRISSLESASSSEEANTEKAVSSDQTDDILFSQKASTKRKPPIISFTPKSILHGIVISEILKRPKY